VSNYYPLLPLRSDSDYVCLRKSKHTGSMNVVCDISMFSSASCPHPYKPLPRGVNKFLKTLANLASLVQYFHSRSQKTTDQKYRKGKWEGKKREKPLARLASVTRQSWILLAFGELAIGYPHPCLPINFFISFNHYRHNIQTYILHPTSIRVKRNPNIAIF
jgi:hypothetical protein